MSIIEYIKEYLELKGVVCGSKDEFDEMISGIKLYLRENGVDETESREYFQRIVTSHFNKIDDRDLKEYLICYKYISKINDIITKARFGATISLEEKAELGILLETLNATSLGEKYVPVDEIRGILGKL
jgi:hypothetical protein